MQVLKNVRTIADQYQGATRRKPEDINPHHVPFIAPALLDSRSSVPSVSTANPYVDPHNPPSASSKEQKVSISVPHLPSPAPQTPTNPPTQPQIHAPSGHSIPSVSTIRGERQLRATKKDNLNAKISTSAALSSSKAQSTLPNLDDSLAARRSRKRRVSDDPAVSNATKKQRTEPLPKSFQDLFYHKNGPKLEIRQRCDWLGMPSIGDQKRKQGIGKKQAKGKGKEGKKRKRKGLSKDQPKEAIEGTPPPIPYVDEVDKAYLDSVLKKLKLAQFLKPLQQIECVVGKDGACDLDGVVRPARSTGIGQVQEGDSIYFTLLSQTENEFLCLICGRTMTIEKQLRALGHVRMHFEHRPFHCTRRIQSKEGEETPCW